MREQERPCLGFHLGTAFRRVDRHFDRVLASMKLTHAHAQVVLCLLEHGEMRLTDVIERTALDQSVASRLTAELGRRRYLRRRPHPKDRRAVLLRAGRRARAVATELRKLRERANDRLYRDLPTEDAAALLRALRVLSRLP